MSASNIPRAGLIALITMSCDIRIGTSGYHYKHWVGTFYPAKTPPAKMLDYYARHFDTLELGQRVRSWAESLKAVYVYFDNDQGGYAAQNALALRNIVFGAVPAPGSVSVAA